MKLAQRDCNLVQRRFDVGCPLDVIDRGLLDEPPLLPGSDRLAEQTEVSPRVLNHNRLVVAVQ